MPERFLAWQRSQVYDLAQPMPEGGRLHAGLPLTLSDINNPADTRGGATPFEILGPGDVAGIVPGAIVARVPAPNSWDAIETKAAHIEFAAADLPWRYTPQTAAPTAALRPWLALVIGFAGTEIMVRPNGTVVLARAVLDAHDLAKSHLWAHVHDFGARKVARLLCPRDMVENTAYVAALVPAFRITGDEPSVALVDAWDAATTTAVLPCYDHWTFRTGPKGDFADLARQLTPVELPTGFGEAKVRYHRTDPSVPPTDRIVELPVAGALARVPALGTPPVDSEPIPPAIAAEVAGIATAARTYQGRWVLTLPKYDEPWPSTDATGWRDTLQRDPAATRRCRFGALGGNRMAGANRGCRRGAGRRAGHRFAAGPFFNLGAGGVARVVDAQSSARDRAACAFSLACPGASAFASRGQRFRARRD
jgi:hypothetical protein